MFFCLFRPVPFYSVLLILSIVNHQINFLFCSGINKNKIKKSDNFLFIYYSIGRQRISKIGERKKARKQARRNYHPNIQELVYYISSPRTMRNKKIFFMGFFLFFVFRQNYRVDVLDVNVTHIRPYVGVIAKYQLREQRHHPFRIICKFNIRTV